MLPALARSVCGSLGLGRALAVPRAAAGGAQQRALTAQHQQQPAVAPFSSGASADIEQQTNEINDAFVQAREDIADARDDAETVYFNESAALARESVEGVLTKWGALLQSVPEKQRGELTRSMGLKMEQLKAELKELDDLHA